jgi:hypothetical protein
LNSSPIILRNIEQQVGMGSPVGTVTNAQAGCPALKFK